jgi:hypothetical protein
MFCRTRITILVSATARSPAKRTIDGKIWCFERWPASKLRRQRSTNSPKLPLNQEIEICPSGTKVAINSGHLPWSR